MILTSDNQITLKIDASELVQLIKREVASAIQPESTQFYSLNEAMAYMGIKSTITFHKRRIEAEVDKAPFKGKYTKEMLDKILNHR